MGLEAQEARVRGDLEALVVQAGLEALEALGVLEAQEAQEGRVVLAEELTIILNARQLAALA